MIMVMLEIDDELWQLYKKFGPFMEFDPQTH
jgi:hypothetical protein